MNDFQGADDVPIPELPNVQSEEELFNAWLVCVGGLYFLRLVNPAIISPETHGLIRSPNSASPSTRRTLTLVVKILQAVSNNVLFGKKEEFMEEANLFVQQHAKSVHEFLEFLASDVAPVETVSVQTLQVQQQPGQTGLRLPTPDHTPSNSQPSSPRSKKDKTALLSALYDIHVFLHDNMQTIRESIQQNPLPFSVPLDPETETLDLLRDTFEKAEQTIQALGEPKPFPKLSSLIDEMNLGTIRQNSRRHLPSLFSKPSKSR